MWLSITTFFCMHIFIIATLIIDVFCWNLTDAIIYLGLYGMLHTGIAWEELPHMHPLLAAYLLAHTIYAIYGHYVPDHVPYVVAHRHAAGNWSQGVRRLSSPRPRRARVGTPFGAFSASFTPARPIRAARATARSPPSASAPPPSLVHNRRHRCW